MAPKWPKTNILQLEKCSRMISFEHLGGRAFECNGHRQKNSLEYFHPNLKVVFAPVQVLLGHSLYVVFHSFPPYAIIHPLKTTQEISMQHWWEQGVGLTALTFSDESERDFSPKRTQRIGRRTDTKASYVTLDDSLNLSVHQSPKDRMKLFPLSKLQSIAPSKTMLTDRSEVRKWKRLLMLTYLLSKRVI